MSKDPKIIRANDRVKIITPEVFVRCGYPLGIVEMREEVKEHFGKMIHELMYSVTQEGDKWLLKDENPSRTIDSSGSQKAKEYYQIIDALAYIRLKAKNFGGNEHKVFTKAYEDIKDKVFYVTGIRFVKTGVRFPGYGGGYYDDDAEPPYLDDVKTHKILTLDLCRQDIDEHFRVKHIHSPSIFKYVPIEIEAKNVEKLPDEREYIQDDDGNFIKNEMYMKETV